MGYINIDDWTEMFHKDLRGDIECHIKQYLKDEKDKYGLRRLIFTSLRQHLGDKTGNLSKRCKAQEKEIALLKKERDWQYDELKKNRQK